MRFYGTVGYAVHRETAPGVWREAIDERQYYGDVSRYARRWENGEYLNSNLTVNHTISIVADGFAYGHTAEIRYVDWMGAKWTVTSVEVQRPRLILSLGEVYHEQT